MKGRAALIMAACLSLASCVDDSYDMSKDIDLTMGLGSKGLQLKLGTTERIMLADILEVDNNLQTDAQNRYYLVEKGNSRVDFTISDVTAEVENTELRPQRVAVDYNLISNQFPVSPDGVHLPAGSTIVRPDAVEAASSIAFDVKDIQSDLTWLKAAVPAAGTKVRIKLYIERNGMDVHFKDVENLVVTLPGYLRLGSATQGVASGNQLKFNSRYNLYSDMLDLGEAEVESVHLPGSMGQVKDGTLHVSDEVKMSGFFNFSTASDIVVREGDYVNVRLVISVGENRGDYSAVSIKEVTGRFAPEITPDIEDIDVAEDLPDFLRDEEVTVTAANPTIRFEADMMQVPVGLNLSAEMESVKQGNPIAAVRLPAAGSAETTPAADNVLYFYQDAAEGPFDPDGVGENSRRYCVENIGELIHRIPDVIQVDLSDGKVRVKDEDYTLRLGHTYAADLDYCILVPFTFNAGLKIVYNDSITGMNEDLKDFQAEGLQITATIENTLPTKLYVSGVAVDTRGNVIPGFHISSAEAEAATGEKEGSEYVVRETPVTLEVTLDNPVDLSRLDRINFNVKAAAETNGGTLCSDQYLRVKDIRLKLTGNIIGNFN